MLKKKHTIKPLYKQFLRLRENVQDRTKILNFKRKKWEKFIEQYNKKLKWFKKFKLKDQIRYIVTKYPNKSKSYTKQFKNNLINKKKIQLVYGGLATKKLKYYLNLKTKKGYKNVKHSHTLFLEFLEKRLDIVLFRSKFTKSVRDAKQLISHGKVFVNNNKVESSSYILKIGDFISINPKSHYLIEKNLKYCIKNKLEKKANLWPLPTKHLTINYKTMEIVFGKIQPTNFESEFSFSLNLEKFLTTF